MQKTLLQSFSLALIAIPLSCLPCFAGAPHVEKAAHAPRQTSTKTSKDAIEQFMMLTALHLIELEWNAGYSNRIPDKAERVRAMISADLSECPQDFREAWLMQTENPRRNYASPVFRKYDVSLATLRKRLAKDLAAIDSSIRPPVPLFDEGETPPSYDPRTCGSREKILKATAEMKLKLYGVDTKMAPIWRNAVERVMLEFNMNYMEAMVRLQFQQLSSDDVERLFKGIKLNQCPPDFRKAWEHDLPFFIKGQFGVPELRAAPTALRYGVDVNQVMSLVRKKMREWDIETPTANSLPTFLKDMNELRGNLLPNR